MASHDYISTGSPDRSVAVCMAACTGVLCISTAWSSSILSSPPSGWWARNSTLVGIIVGVLLGGLLADIAGRKLAIAIGSAVFIAGRWAFVAVPAAQDNWPVTALFIQSIGTSSYLFALKIYCVEVAVKEKRGLIAAFAVLLMGIGNFLGNTVVFDVDHDTRRSIAYVLPQAPMVLFAIGCYFLPESARWVCLRQGKARAETSLEQIRGTTYVESEMNAIANQVATVADRAGWRSLTHATIMKRIVTVVILLILGAVASSAVNVWISTLLSIEQPEDFAMSAFGGSRHVLLLIIFILPAIPALYVVDALGRRRLLLVGAVGMVVAHAIAGIALASGCDAAVWGHNCTQGSAVGVFAGAMVGLFSFGACWAPVLWLYPEEIFPTNVRAKATAICAALAGTSGFWTEQLTLSLSERSLLSIVSVLFCFVAMAVVYVFCPETKRLAIEDTEELFADGRLNKPQQSDTGRATETLLGGDPTQSV